MAKKIKISRPDTEILARVKDWPIWECAPSSFAWHYDQEESCYILEGEVTVKTATEEVVITAGDFVTFPEGLDCNWSVTKAIRKHYNFS